METSSILASIALLVSMLSALYTRWTWNEAKHANAIALHNNQMKIYKSFTALKFAMIQESLGISGYKVAQFYDSSQDAKFYFNDYISQKVEQYFNICFKLSKLNDKLDREMKKQNNDEKIEIIYKEQDLLQDKEMELSLEIDRILSDELKLFKK